MRRAEGLIPTISNRGEHVLHLEPVCQKVATFAVTSNVTNYNILYLSTTLKCFGISNSLLLHASTPRHLLEDYSNNDQ